MEQQEANGICDSKVADCLKELSGTERQTLLRAVERTFNSNLSDSYDRGVCSDLRAHLQIMVANNLVFRGAYSTDSDNHDGEIYKGKIHIDNDLWMDLRDALEAFPQTDATRQSARDAQERIAAIGLHEVAHAMGMRHGANEGVNGYTSYPFNMTDPRGPGNKCVNF